MGGALNPLESLAVIMKNKKYIVLDGNRRLASIKLINNPNLIKNNQNAKSFFQNLKNNYSKNLPKKMDCVVFTKKDANKWIQLKHTGMNGGAGPVQWGNEEKARFNSQISGKKLVEHTQVLDFMKANDINVSHISPTNMERLISSPQARKHIGINFQNNSLDFDISKQKVINNLKKIASKMENNFTSRVINTKNQQEKWIVEALDIKQSPKNQIRELLKNQRRKIHPLIKKH